MPFGLGATESLIILGIIILFFGAKRLPAMGGAMGKGILEFTRNVRDRPDGDESEQGEDEPTKQTLDPTGTDDGVPRKVGE